MGKIKKENLIWLVIYVIVNLVLIAGLIISSIYLSKILNTYYSESNPNKIKLILVACAVGISGFLLVFSWFNFSNIFQNKDN